jgi:hypothetical protein
MFPILRQHWMLWGIWILTASILLFANPWIGFSWPELVACIGSLMLAVDRRTRRETLLAVGLPMIALLAVVDANGVSVARLVADWFFFIGAVLLGARAVEDQVELEAIAGHLVLGSDPERALAEFKKSVESEIARARRHERSFVILSFAPLAHSVKQQASAPGGSLVLARLAEARWILELREVLSDENHLYAAVTATQDRVLCLIPEVNETEIDALSKRLAVASLDRLGLEIETGLASFPRDALRCDDLIATADEARRAPKLESVPTQSELREEGGAGSLARDVER